MKEYKCPKCNSKNLFVKKVGIIRDCIAGIAVHGLNGSEKMS